MDNGNFVKESKVRQEAQPAPPPPDQGAIAGILKLPGVVKIMETLGKTQQRFYELLIQNDGQWFKNAYYTLGTNPPGNVSYAFRLYAGGASGNSQSLAILNITDVTLGESLLYVYGTGAIALGGLTENATSQVIYEQISAANWYFRIANWTLDWLAVTAYGGIPNIADTWRIGLVVYEHGYAVATTVLWDALWMGNVNPPRYDDFLVMGVKRQAWSTNSFNGQIGSTNTWGYDYDGLFLSSQAPGASAYVGLHELMGVISTSASNHQTLKFKITAIFIRAYANLLNSIGVDIVTASGTSWNVLSTTNFYANGVVYSNFGSIVSVSYNLIGTNWLRPVFFFRTGVGGNIYAFLSIGWMSYEEGLYPTQPSTFYLKYYSLDGWGVPFNLAKTYMNGTELPDYPIFTDTARFYHYLNLTVTDYFNNIVYQHIHQVNDTLTTLDVQLQLVQVTMQSVGLTSCVITQIGGSGLSKNITFYDSGSTLLYATASGISYRFHGMAYISSNTLIPAGVAYDVTTTITTAQSRTVVLMTSTILKQILDTLTEINSKPPAQGGGGVLVTPAELGPVSIMIIILAVIAVPIVLAVIMVPIYERSKRTQFPRQSAQYGDQQRQEIYIPGQRPTPSQRKQPPTQRKQETHVGEGW